MVSEVKVAYAKQDIDCGKFVIKQGAVFIAKGKKKLVGLWQGGTDQIEKLDIGMDWLFDGKLSFYKVSESCLRCKYNLFFEKGYSCDSETCVLSEMEEDPFSD